jgi:hypothetical protein
MSVLRSTTSVGDILWIQFPKGRKLGKVVKKNPKNFRLVLEDGTNVNASPFYLDTPTASESGEWLSGSASAARAGAPTSLLLGQVVRFLPPSAKKYEGLYVVLGQHSGTYRVARLGGNKNRYVRGVLPERVEVVDFELAGV